MGRARARGARQAYGPAGEVIPRLEWDIAGDCEEPVYRALYWRASVPVSNRGPVRNSYDIGAFLAQLEQLFGSVSAADIRVRPGRKRRTQTVTVKPGEAGPLTLVLQVRCRTCSACGRQRRRLWAARAHAETEASFRTWFCTLTLSPQVRERCLTAARLHCRRRGVDFDQLSEPEQFAFYGSEMMVDVTKYLKLLRKGYSVPQKDGTAKWVPGAAFRYLVALESHKDGAPHVHLLLHEQDPKRPLRKSRLEMRSRHHPFGAWRGGFTKHVLVGEDVTQRKAVGYVVKYVAKQLGGRVRASLRYGDGRSSGTGRSVAFNPPKEEINLGRS